jgi:predicted nuclease with TOPRIM domain
MGALEETIVALNEEQSRLGATLKKRLQALEARFQQVETGVRELQGSRFSVIGEPLESGAEARSQEPRRPRQVSRIPFSIQAAESGPGSRAEADANQREVRERLREIIEKELRPLQERIHELRLGLEELHQRERELQRQLQAARREVGPKTQELEGQLISVLEEVLSAFAAAESARQDIETAPAPSDGATESAASDPKREAAPVAGGSGQ